MRVDLLGDDRLSFVESARRAFDRSWLWHGLTGTGETKGFIGDGGSAGSSAPSTGTGVDSMGSIGSGSFSEQS